MCFQATDCIRKPTNTNSHKQQKQEAQLSQTDCATFHVIEYFAKSLKVTEGHSK